MQLKEVLKRAVTQGLPFPHAYDPVDKVPSFRLLAAYISFMLATGSVLALHFYPQVLAATGVSIAFFALCMVFYMLKKLQQAKISLESKEISLEGEKSVDKPEVV